MKKIIVLSLLILAFAVTAYAQPKLEFKASGFIDIISNYNRNVPEIFYSSQNNNLFGPPIGVLGNTAPQLTGAGGVLGQVYPIPTALMPPGSIFSPDGLYNLAGRGTTYLGTGAPSFLYTTPGSTSTTTAPIFANGFNRKQAFMTTRGRLKFDAIMGKEMSGTFFFEVDSTRWGDNYQSSGIANSQRNLVGTWGGDRAGVEIKNMYLTFGLPYIGIPVPITFQGGLLPLAIRPHFFTYVDGTGINVAANIAPVTAKFSWFKMLEVNDFTSDDCDAYALDVNAKVGPLTIGAYGLNFNANTYPGTKTPMGNLFTINTNLPKANQGNWWWLGMYVDGKLGPLGIQLDAVYDKGKIEDNRHVGTTALPYPQPDIKFKGWAARGKVDYPWEKFNFGMVGLYATGSDLQKTAATPLPGTRTTLGTFSTKVGGYINPIGSEGGAGDDLILVGSMLNRGTTGYFPMGDGFVTRGTFGGLWYAKAYAGFKATPWYKVSLEGLYIGDTTKNGNTIGTALKTGFSASPTTVKFFRDDKTVGWEVNVINEIQIYSNLKLSVFMAYLFAGDAMDQNQWWYSVGPYVPNKSPRDPWLIGTNLTYNF